MFKKGDYVIYETAGVCRVTDVSTVDMKGIDREKLFYFLEPLHMNGNRLYIPVENHKSFMRPLLSSQEAERLMEDAGKIGALPVADYRHREEDYKAALKSCDCREWLKIIHTLRRKRVERTGQGKKLPSMDARYLQIAEECLYTELSLAMGLPEEKIELMISEEPY